MRQRIQTLDGLRFLAALGVLWIHCWGMFGHPRFYVGRVDIADILAIGGNGVDLFFVISGFCMYYFYASKTDFSYHDFYRFLVKRWVRLSPAFYTATIIYALYRNHGYSFDTGIFLGLLDSLFYLNAIFQTTNIASHFWTLGVEWQFYLLIPLLLIYQNVSGFKTTFIYIFGGLLLISFISVFIFKAGFDLLTFQIFFRGAEFGCGVLAGRLLLSSAFVLKNRGVWLLIFMVITYTGRILISKRVLDLSANYYNLFKIPGFSLLGAGFAGILYLTITSTGRLHIILGNTAFKTMGKVSYSFYLWHSLINLLVESYLLPHLSLNKNFVGAIELTAISCIILFPVSLLSYRLLEQPFLKAGNLTTK